MSPFSLSPSEGHKRDSCALVEFLAQLEKEVEVDGVQNWDEISAADRDDPL